MSWSISTAGKAADVKASFAQRVEQVKAYTHVPDVEKAVLDAHAAVVAAQCDAAGDRTLLAESSGHCDTSGRSNSTLACRSFDG